VCYRGNAGVTKHVVFWPDLPAAKTAQLERVIGYMTDQVTATERAFSVGDLLRADQEQQRLEQQEAQP